MKLVGFERILNFSVQFIQLANLGKVSTIVEKPIKISFLKHRFLFPTKNRWYHPGLQIISAAKGDAFTFVYN